MKRYTLSQNDLLEILAEEYEVTIDDINWVAPDGRNAEVFEINNRL